LAAPDPQMYTHTRAPLRRSFCRRTHPAVTRIRQQKPRARRGTRGKCRSGTSWLTLRNVRIFYIKLPPVLFTQAVTLCYYEKKFAIGLR
jgi:hypothetical protein